MSEKKTRLFAKDEQIQIRELVKIRIRDIS